MVVTPAPAGRSIGAPAGRGAGKLATAEGVAQTVSIAWWRELLAGPVLAVQFLTAIPLPLAMPAGPRHLGRALACFPVVGVALGVVLALFDAAVLHVLPPSVTTVLVLVAATLLTGGLHLDGLMDTCDGLFGGRTRERRLEIMRDSRVGSYGVLGGALQLLLKYAVLVALPPALRGPTLVVALTAGRWAMVGVMWLFPYARPDGLGAAFKAGNHWTVVVVATLVTIAIAWATLGLAGLALVALAGVVAWLSAASATNKLGGLTGDCYGAVNELVESVVLLAILAGASYFAGTAELGGLGAVGAIGRLAGHTGG